MFSRPQLPLRGILRRHTGDDGRHEQMRPYKCEERQITEEVVLGYVQKASNEYGAHDELELIKVRIRICR